jgi:hypothetical protein
MFRNLRLVTKVWLAQRWDSSRRGIVAASFGAGSFSASSSLLSWCPYDRGDELGGHGEDEYRYQRKRLGPRGVDHRLLRLLYFLGPASSVFLRLLRFRPSPRQSMDEDLVQLASEALAMLGGTCVLLAVDRLDSEP